ncbi:LysR family transcriptional regulator [Herbaspirillum sp. alder98]|uniref:LysR family transcriptional regulator n=1 Tax=Herbaspirillum sp. alder98 TaxID=2913096 RepID=UPI001CD86B5C|nr:LysR family transcriptional regulator [Herbaspirillum sp. alder98]MCA1325836.1 LysR family transcriptional regulator [Herbaspirillum sp. alder98]
MELRHLRYFLAVADHQSFTRAAEQVGIGQPPLSMQIKALEQEIGSPLFKRTSHGVELSEVGRAFLPHARQAVDDAQRALRVARQAASGEVGVLRMGFTSSAVFHRLVSHSIQQFRQQHPGLEISLSEGITEQLLADIAGAQLDAAFVRIVSIPSAELGVVELPAERLKVALPRSHRLSRRKSLRLIDLAQEKFIMVPRGKGSALYDGIFSACQAAGFDPQVIQLAPQLTSAINLVAAGLGISIVPEAIEQVQLEQVRYIDIAEPAPRAQLSLAYHRQSIAATRFAAHLQRQLTQGH